MWTALDKCAENKNIFFIGTSNRKKEYLPEALLSRFNDEDHGIITIPLPPIEQRMTAIKYYINEWQTKAGTISLSEDEIKKIAKKTKGMTLRDLRRMVKKAISYAQRRNDFKAYTVKLNDFEKAIRFIRKEGPSLYTRIEKKIETISRNMWGPERMAMLAATLLGVPSAILSIAANSKNLMG